MGSNRTVVIIGGGIAGISCLETLARNFDHSNAICRRIVLVTNARLVKRVKNYESSGRQLEMFDIAEDDVDQLNLLIPQGLKLETVIGNVDHVNYAKKSVIYHEFTSSGEPSPKELPFDILCICSGSKPRILSYTNQGSAPEIDNRVIVVKDVDTVNQLKIKLANCKRVMIVGNGGISLETVSKISNCEKVWVIRDDAIGTTFFDSGASKFLLDAFAKCADATNVSVRARDRKSVTLPTNCPTGTFGPSLGPSWAHEIEFHGSKIGNDQVEIIYNDEVSEIERNSAQEYHLIASTANGLKLSCDLVISAIGVTPNIIKFVGGCLDASKLDNGIIIDDQMRTSLDQVYAAGDVVSCEKWPSNPLWSQMRLWTQARHMGHYLGTCVSHHIMAQDPRIYFNFDCFTHCTSFFGFRLVLLGNYNGQSIEQADASNCEVIARVNPGKDYVKLVLDRGKVIGAVLVGDCGLEETIENLIHDGLDVSKLKDQLLDDTVDIEDYFD